MELILRIVFGGVIAIIIYYFYQYIFKSYKSMDIRNIKSYYAKNYKKYLEVISIFRNAKVLPDTIGEVQKIYKKRKEEKYIESDELEIKNIINNLKNNNFTQMPLSCVLITIGITISLTILNIKSSVNYYTKINNLVWLLILIMVGITLEVINYDFESIKKCRKLSFYELLLEIIYKIKKNEFDANEILEFSKEEFSMFKKLKDVWNNKIGKIVIVYVVGSIVFPSILKVIYNNQSYSDWYNFLGGFVGGAIGGIATLIAIVISTNQTRKIQEDAMNLEDKREKDKIKENALIVYYDLLYGLNDLKKLYIGIVKGKVRSNIPNRMYFCNNWIERVALFSHSNELKDKIDEIYLLYGDLMIIRDLLCKNIIFDTNTPKYTELKEKIIEISKKAFNIKDTALSDINTNNTYDADQWEDVKKEIISIESTFGGKKETRRILNNKYEKILMKLKEVGL